MKFLIKLSIDKTVSSVVETSPTHRKEQCIDIHEMEGGRLRFRQIPSETIWSEAGSWLIDCVWRAKAFHREMGYRKLYAIIPETHAKNQAREAVMDADEKAYQKAMKQVAIEMNEQFTHPTEYVERQRLFDLCSAHKETVEINTEKATRAKKFEAEVYELKQLISELEKVPGNWSNVDQVEKVEKVEKVKVVWKVDEVEKVMLVKRSHTRYMLRRVRCGMSKRHLLHKVNKRKAKLYVLKKNKQSQ